MLLERRGLRVKMQKLDPYINVAPGTMTPYQHGEVYVLDDGSETDLDLGHYERFTNSPLSRDSNYTTGQIYLSVIEKERRGEYLGKTIQIIPHITNEIKSVIHKLADAKTDVVITEIGGTAGDIESQPFLEAIRQFSLDVGKENCLYIHLTLVPYLKAAGELKTKPTQHSVGQLRQIGIQPDILICRTETPIPVDARKKMALFCNVALEAVIEEKDKELSIYEVPLSLVENGLDELIVKKLGLDSETLELDDWRDLIHRLRNPQHDVSIAVVGKYVEHSDAYKSIYEALDHAGVEHEGRVTIGKIRSEDLEKRGPEHCLDGYDAVLVPGGFGDRGIEGKIHAIRFARERGIPFFGICLGLQCAVSEFARNVIGLDDANSTEFNEKTPHPVICLLDAQRKIVDKGGTMRLGAQPTDLKPSTLAAECYGASSITERHRHRYEFNANNRDQFESHGMIVAGTSDEGKLVEIVEIPSHPWFVAVQFHPEFKSKPTAVHPLFSGFVEAAIRHRVSRSKQVEEIEV